MLGTTSWAFIDFATTEYATQALTNPRNHSLDGRALVVEYASPDAVRRSGLSHGRGPDEEPSTGKPPNRASRRPQKAERIAAKSVKSGTKVAVADEGDENPINEGAQNEEERTTVLRDERHRPLRSVRGAKRARPGAALASAPRQSGAIVTSMGKRTIF